MTRYRVAVGEDVALADLTLLDPQPRSPGVKAVRRSIVASDAVYEEGAYLELEWDALGDGAEYLALLTLFGLHLALTVKITVYARDQFFQWQRYVGLAVRPEQGEDVRWTNYLPRDVTILVKSLRLAT